MIITLLKKTTVSPASLQASTRRNYQPFPTLTSSIWSSHQLHSLLSSLFTAEGDEGVAPVQPAERVHHEPEVPDGPGFLKQRNQLVLKQVARDLPNKDLMMRREIETFYHNSIISGHKNILHTSVPTGGWAPVYTDSGGGPPYFLWPVVTSSVYSVLSRRALILASSGPLEESDTFVPCFSRCLYVFITPHRKALLFCNETSG